MAAAAAGARGVYPTPNEELNASTTYNFTTSARDDSNLARTFDAASLAIEKDGMPYSTTTIPGLGQFPGTYSFEDDVSGGLATGWTYGFYTSCSGQVVDSFQGHQKVLQLTDGSGAGNYGATQTFDSSQTSGTISLWFACTAVGTGPNVILLYDGSDNNLINIYITGGNFVFYHPPSTTIAPYVINRWYHWTVEFDTGTDTANVTLDGSRKLTNEPFTTSGNAATKYTAASGTSESYTEYIDAIDYSWSPGYVANRSAFDLSPLGEYNAMQSFNDPPFTYTPSGFGTPSVASGGAFYTTPGIFIAAGGHKNLLYSRAASGLNDAQSYWSVGGSPTSCTIEYWAYFISFGGAQGVAYSYVWDSTASLAAAYIRTVSGGTFQHNPGGSGWVGITTFSLSTWYNIRLFLNATTQKYDIYVNGMLLVSQGTFGQAATNIGYLHVGNYDGGETYWDALDASTNSTWYPGRCTYMLLQSYQTFSDAGSYTFRYTLTSSGMDYVPSWTPFTVVVPAVPPVPTHVIYFSTSSTDLIGVPAGTAFLYVDDALKLWDAVELVNGIHNITVRDYFGVILLVKEELFNVSSNYGIILPMGTLVANNYNDKPAALEITKSGGTGTLRQLLGPQDSFAVRLAAGTYHVRLYDLDGTMIGEYALVTLTAGENEAVDFGSAPTMFTMDWIILVALVGACAILILVTIARSGHGRRGGRR